VYAVGNARVARATASERGKDNVIAELECAKDELLKKLLLRHERRQASGDTKTISKPHIANCK
jgi:hypothetical protein